MNKTLAAFFVLSLLVAPAPATAGAAGGGARAFDFWIGEWTIHQKILQPDGSWLELRAKTSVSPGLGGSALVEHWQGEVKFFWEGMKEVEPMEGLSVRSYDAEAGLWRIYWMDTRIPRFGDAFEGRFTDGRGEFFRQRERPQGTQIARITFSDIHQDSARWELAISNDHRQTWTTLWIMEMQRADD